MNLRFAGIEHSFECSNGEYFNSLVIENPRMLFDMITDMEKQIQGEEGQTVVSENDKVLSLDKHLELLSVFVPFSINQKQLINKIIQKLIENATDPEFFMRSEELLRDIEQYCMDISMNLVGDIDFKKISVEGIIKASGPEISDDYETLSEKLMDYFELVREYDREKVFVLVNLRSFIPYEELKGFINEVLLRKYQIILIDNKEYLPLDNEKRVIIDDSLCEIC